MITTLVKSQPLEAQLPNKPAASSSGLRSSLRLHQIIAKCREHFIFALWLSCTGNDMFMDLGEKVRFKVRSVRFKSPPTPLQLQNASNEDKLLGTSARPFAPMEVIGDMNGDGLGLLSWWGGGEEEEENAQE